MAKEKINIFWDNSNILLTGVSECEKREPNDTQVFAYISQIYLIM